MPPKHAFTVNIEPDLSHSHLSPASHPGQPSLAAPTSDISQNSNLESRAGVIGDFSPSYFFWPGLGALPPATLFSRQVPGLWSTQRHGCAGAIVNSKLHVVGGRGHTTTLASAEVFDFASGQWRPLPGMSCPRQGCGAARVHGQSERLPQRIFRIFNRMLHY